ncbi:MAG: condensation domain-containing protein, partial [Candidatus Eisenbacteria bacterium]
MKPESVEALYRLTPLQEGMLFHSLLESSPGVFAVQVACVLEGTLEPAHLREAWARVVAQHPILRTSFHWEEGDKPLQLVHRQVDLPWREEDWSGLAESAWRTRLEGFLADDRRRGFDLARAPLLRLSLIRLGEKRWAFAWTHHHLLLDGWSTPIVLGDVFAVHAALVENRAPAIRSPRPYRDFIAWHLARAEEGGDEAATFWRARLGDFVTPTPLPLSSSTAGGAAGAAPGSLEHGEHRHEVGEQTTRALTAAARGLGVTLATLLEGAWGLLLGRLTGESDVVFGTVVSGRPPELTGSQEMVGLFINTVPVRVRLDEEMPVGAWLRGLQQARAAASRHDHAGLVAVQGWSGVPRGTPLFDSLLILENFPLEAALDRPIPGLRMHDVRSSEANNHALTLTVLPGPLLRLRLEFDPALFERRAIERLAVHLERLLAGLAAGAGDAERRLGEVSLLDAGERSAELARGQGMVHRLPGGTVVDGIAAQVAATPAGMAVRDERTALDYATLWRRAGGL